MAVTGLCATPALERTPALYVLQHLNVLRSLYLLRSLVQVAFDVHTVGILRAVEVAVDVIFWMDLVFNLNTAVKDEIGVMHSSVLVVDRKCVPPPPTPAPHRTPPSPP